MSSKKDPLLAELLIRYRKEQVENEAAIKTLGSVPSSINEIRDILIRGQKVAKEWEQRHIKLSRWLILIAIIQTFGVLYEPNMVRNGILNFIGTELISLRPGMHETRTSPIDGRYRISRVLTIEDNRWFWLTARAYEASDSQKLTISGFSEKICSADGKLDIWIKVGDDVHYASTKLSSDGKSLIFASPVEWIKRVNSSNGIVIGIDDDCGSSTYLTFITKGKIDLSFPPKYRVRPVDLTGRDAT